MNLIHIVEIVHSKCYHCLDTSITSICWDDTRNSKIFAYDMRKKIILDIVDMLRCFYI